MKFTVLINNHNYGRYLARAVASVRAQTRPADEIILVDDGSTDHSPEVARRCAAEEPRLRVITQENGGQLSAFNAGFRAATGDILTFLDADDEYLPGWLARLEEVYTRRPEVDFVFCRCEITNGGGRRPPWEMKLGDFDFGQSFYRAWLRGEWLGGPTTALSARRELLARFLPCAQEARWRTRADDVLVMGASLMGGRKLHLADRLVRYHVHGHNNWFGHEQDPLARFRATLARRHLTVQLLDGSVRARVSPDDLPAELLREFRTIPRPRLQDARRYARMVHRFASRDRWAGQGRVWLAWAATLWPGKSHTI
jgi:glycosyltransferase involved in cell wall biosynthesis